MQNQLFYFKSYISFNENKIFHDSSCVDNQCCYIHCCFMRDESKYTSNLFGNRAISQSVSYPQVSNIGI